LKYADRRRFFQIISKLPRNFLQKLKKDRISIFLPPMVPLPVLPAVNAMNKAKEIAAKGHVVATFSCPGQVPEKVLVTMEFARSQSLHVSLFRLSRSFSLSMGRAANRSPSMDGVKPEII